ALADRDVSVDEHSCLTVDLELGVPRSAKTAEHVIATHENEPTRSGAATLHLDVAVRPRLEATCLRVSDVDRSVRRARRKSPEAAGRGQVGDDRAGKGHARPAARRHLLDAARD